MLNIKPKLLYLLIFVVIIINFSGMFLPSLNSTFIPYYGSIAKHMLTTNNWSDLILINQEWLDKPHLPFWMTVISFKLFGINTFSYVLPGFIFHLLGAFYTYKIAQYFYDKQTALLSAFLYLTSFHLLTSSIDVRAEAYLLGSIIPACYYFLLYDSHYNKKYYISDKYKSQKSSLRYLLLGSIFTACALMTKGPFVIINIFSGTLIIFMIQKRLKEFLSFKWLIVIVVSFLFITPEIFALYHQFDSHPEKIIFEHQNVSGIKWFFWDSQFGRFFNTGPIHNTNPSNWHYIYFIHVFLWSFLPWSLLFIIASYYNYTNCKQSKNNQNHQKNDLALYYLYAAFFIPFIIFSITSFQVDHYINILFPFASIIVARFLLLNTSSQTNLLKHKSFNISKLVYKLQIAIVILIAFVLLSTSILLSNILQIKILIIITVLVLLLLYKFINLECLITRALTLSMSAILSIFFVFNLINGIEYAKYDAGYQIANYLNNLKIRTLVLGYNIDLKSLNLNLSINDEYRLFTDFSKLINTAKINLHNDNQDLLDINSQVVNHNNFSKIYIVINQNNLSDIQKRLGTLDMKYKILTNNFYDLSIENFLRNSVYKNLMHFGIVYDPLVAEKYLLLELVMQ